MSTVTYSFKYEVYFTDETYYAEGKIVTSKELAHSTLHNFILNQPHNHDNFNGYKILYLGEEI